MPEHTEQSPAIKKFIRFLKLFLFVIGFFFAVQPVIKPYYSLLPPPAFSTLSTKELDDFSEIHLDNADLKNGYCMSEFYPLMNTPYIFCHLLPHDMILNDKKFHSSNKILLLDLNKEKIVLNVDWENFYSVDKRIYNPESMIKNMGMYLLDNKPHLLLDRKAFLLPEYLQTFNTFLPHFFLDWIVNPKPEMWAVDLQGNTKKLKVLEHALFEQKYIRPLDFTKIAGINFNLLYEYQISDGEFKENHHWPEFNTQHAPVFQLPGGGYLLNQKQTKDSQSIVFLNRKHPQITRFTIGQLSKLFTRSTEIPGKPRVIPLSVTNSNTLLAYIHVPFFPIFEFHLEEFGQESFEKKVRFVGYGGNLEPLWAFENNQVIVFKEYDPANSVWNNMAPPVTFSCSKLFYAKTNELSPHGNNMSEDILTSFRFPFITQFSITPLDDSHLLAFSENTFWRYKWDGSEVKQLFPRSPSLNLPQTLPESPIPSEVTSYDSRIMEKKENG